MTYDLEKNVVELINAIKSNYYKYTSRNGTRELTEVNKRMIDEFNASLKYVAGRKYVKIIQNNSVWGFVQIENDDRFHAGDILKAAGWATPARNKSRGNVLVGNYNANWTGAC